MTADTASEQQGETTGENSTTGTATNAASEAAANSDSSGQAGTEGEQSTSKRGRPKGASAKKTRTVQLTLTVTGTADGNWQAELKHGGTWVARGLDVPASAVSRAAKELHDELSGPIDDVINAAREQQQAKVAQLEAELEQAKKALAELES
ncbi:DUF6319 family protein [Haloechinothrix sp. LS1_15]|uniref:DUF6319 family protein n=1 Tax=Haloechinothrix sp. LS1_15 TaxID=2652248 RepID=UPI0029483441|nr:DUF6319 family protein [Haloechinothrix sp. LS1_15]MDV6012182.1 hypothetical protein [Haloechinothrix sp. LS1_15]